MYQVVMVEAGRSDVILEYIWKVEPTGFAVALDGGHMEY